MSWSLPVLVPFTLLIFWRVMADPHGGLLPCTFPFASLSCPMFSVNCEKGHNSWRQPCDSVNGDYCKFQESYHSMFPGIAYCSIGLHEMRRHGVDAHRVHLLHFFPNLTAAFLLQDVGAVVSALRKAAPACMSDLNCKSSAGSMWSSPPP